MLEYVEGSLLVLQYSDDLLYGDHPVLKQRFIAAISKRFD
jgi:hypothetical protein